MLNARSRLNRREFLKILAVAGGVAVGGDILQNLLGTRAIVLHENRYLMGTVINLTLVAESREQGQAAISEVFQEMARLVHIFDHRRPGGPLARLNQEGRLDQPPAELASLISRALKFGDLSNGAFDITVKPVLDACRSGETRLSALLDRVDYRQVSVRPDRIRLGLPGMQITLDGIAKGSIVDASLTQLQAHGFQKFLVEAGGDLYVQGPPGDERPWKIAIAHPRKTQGHPWITTLKINARAVATSGDYLNTFSNDYSLNHIIDPRVGLSPTELCSATVIAPDTTTADALGTALMVLGVREGLALVENLDGVEALLVTKNLDIIHSPGFPRLLN